MSVPSLHIPLLYVFIIQTPANLDENEMMFFPFLKRQLENCCDFYQTREKNGYKR